MALRSGSSWPQVTFRVVMVLVSSDKLPPPASPASLPSAFSQELAAEKAKAAAGEAKVKKQLVAREQEITAVQARMQASYREHVQEVQRLQGKVGSRAGTDARGRGPHHRVCLGEGCFTWPDGVCV